MVVEYENEIFIVFGKESVGLSKNIINANKDNTYKIPLFSNHVRSLNLANAVGVVVYEGLRNKYNYLKGVVFITLFLICVKESCMLLHIVGNLASSYNWIYKCPFISNLIHKKCDMTLTRFWYFEFLDV